MRTRSSKEFTADAEAEEPKKDVKKKTPSKKEKTPSTTPTPVEEPVETTDDTEKPVFTEEEIEKAKQLFLEGKRHFLCGSMAEASDALSQVCEIFGAHFGEKDRECADPLYYYGRALLELARKEPDVVAGAVDGTCLANIDKPGDQETDDNGAGLIEGGEPDDMTPDEVREKVLDALDENAEELEKAVAKKAAGETTDAAVGETGKDAGDSTEAKTTDEAAMEASDGEEDNGDGEENGDDEGDKENPDQMTAEEVGNLQLAWEVLDTCRIILEQFNDKAAQERLADCRLALGEQATEDEQFEKAAIEYNSALDLYTKVLEPDDRRIALTHFNIGVMFNLMEEYEKAVGAFKKAIETFKMRIDNFKSKLAAFSDGDDQTEKNNMESDIKEFEALVADIESRIQDCVESRAQTDAAKDAMNEQNGTKVNGGSAEKPDSSAEVSDASHLVRKSVKRVSGGDETGNEEPSKKAKLDTEGPNGDTNGHGDAAETVATVE